MYRIWSELAGLSEEGKECEAEVGGSEEEHFTSDCGKTESLEFCIRLCILPIMKLTTELPF